MMGYLPNCLKAGRQQLGAVAVEFAIVIPVLLLLVAGIIEFGRAFWYYDALTKATRDGARYMSIAPKATINSVAIPAAQAFVVSSANAASISPALTTSNVVVTCLDASFQPIACQDAGPIENVKVAITGYSITIGGWIGFVLPSGGVASFTPHTTMRYMCIVNSATTCY